MRDDIHKSAPVGRAWQNLMKHCARQADRKERAAQSAYRALANDCKNELSPAFLDQLRGILSDPQSKLFRERIASSCAAGSVDRGGHVMEQSFLAHLNRRETSGQSGKAAVLGAMADAVSGRKSSQLRTMEGHWLKKGGLSAAPAVMAAKEALNKLSCTEIASKIIDGHLDMPRPTKKVSLDEDLRMGESL